MIDLTSMLINLSHSLEPVQRLLSGMGYLFGILMVVSGLVRLKKVAESRGQGGHQEGGMFTSLAFIIGGAVLIYLPSSVDVLSNTFFGATNILSYTSSGQDPFYQAMLLLIKTTGVIWFLRGTVLIINASKPGEQNGPKGFTFLIAGVFAMNMSTTILVVHYAFDHLFAMMAGFKS